MYENYGLLIGGRWQSASDQEIISVMSPVTEQQIGTIPAATREDIERTLVFCQQAGLEWRKTSAWSRAAILRHTADLIRSRIDEIAKIMSTETGKPLVKRKQRQEPVQISLSGIVRRVNEHMAKSSHLDYQMNAFQSSISLWVPA